MKFLNDISSQASNSEHHQDLSLKDYFPAYQSLFNALQYLLGSFSPAPTEVSPEIISQSRPSIHGRILVETPPGHDIQKFMQIYASSSGMGYFILDVAQLSKEAPDKQAEMLIQFFQNQSADIPFIFYIPFDQFLHKIIHESDLFLNLIKECTKCASMSKKCITIFSIHTDLVIPEIVLNFFDLEFTLKLPDFAARKQFLVTALENFTPKALDIDFDHLSLQLEGWNFMDLRRFVKNATFLFLSEKYVHLKPKVLETSFLTNPLEKRIIRMPQLNQSNSQTSFSSATTLIQPISQLENNISVHDRRFSQQLYQDAASRDYEKLVIILDKLQKGIVFQQFERELLGDYPFFLKTEPKQALQKLNKAKIRIEKIQRLIPSAKNQTI